MAGMTHMPIYIGCAGWGVASGHAAFPGPGQSVLERYAARLGAVEINSSFYRPHRRSTYERWAASVPDEFRFSVKVPRTVTHQARLRDSGDLLSAFVTQAGGLGAKLGGLLVQLPPSLVFDPQVARAFFADLRALSEAPVVCEPRHLSWFTPEAGAVLEASQVGRVAADPAISPLAAQPGGSGQITYYRWHGSPRMYSSSYPDPALHVLAQRLEHGERRRPAWVMFDNTAAGAAADNALTLRQQLGARLSPGQ